MSTKLTLTIEGSIIELAKKYAREKNRSLSDIIENYLKNLVSGQEAKTKKKSAPLVQSLRGSFKLPKDFDYKSELQDELSKKYLS